MLSRKIPIMMMNEADLRKHHRWLRTTLATAKGERLWSLRKELRETEAQMWRRGMTVERPQTAATWRRRLLEHDRRVREIDERFKR